MSDPRVPVPARCPRTVQIIVSRAQKDALKAQGWRVVGTHGGGGYIMESPHA